MTSKSKNNEQNVGNLANVITRIATYGEKYNPSEERLTLPKLVRLRTDGEDVITRVNKAKDVHNHAISARASLFAELPGILTRSINGLRISGVSEQTIDQASSMIRAIPASKEPAVELTENGGEVVTKKRNKSHSSSMESRVELFGQLVLFLKSIPNYKPNEKELTIEGLEARLLSLRLAISAYQTADAQLDLARLDRHAILYQKKTGLVPIALDVKRYVKSVFGATSPEYKSISDILFINKKKI